jgi:hypothetical protein
MRICLLAVALTHNAARGIPRASAWNFHGGEIALCPGKEYSFLRFIAKTSLIESWRK